MCSLKDSKNFFQAICTSVYIMLNLYTIKCPYHRHGILTENIFTYFCCRWFFKIILTSIYSFNQRFKICLNNRQYLIKSNVRYWLNSNILASSEGVITPQRSLFSHTCLWDSSLFFVPNKWRQFKQFKITDIWRFPFNIADDFLLQDNAILLLLESL